MRIENLYQEQIVNQYNQSNTTAEQENEKKSKTTGKDLFEISDEIPVLPSETYNDFGQAMKSQMSAETGTEEDEEESTEMKEMPPAPPMPPIEETETDDSVVETVNSVISKIAEALNVSEDDVFEALESLELTPNDLLSEEGLTSVVNTLGSNTTTVQESAASTVKEDTTESASITDTSEDTLSATIVSLKEFMESALESLKEKLGMTEEEFEEFLN